MSRHGDELRFRDVNRILIRNGYTPTTCRGSHQKYERNGRHIVISHLRVNRMMWQRLVKENGINENI